MKTVFDTQQCAHVWAQRTQPHARRVLSFVDGLRQRAPGLEWTRSESEDGRDAFTLGQFTLDRITLTGLHAGCHFISWTELDRVRPQLVA